jgi:hypothetical protein
VNNQTVLHLSHGFGGCIRHPKLTDADPPENVRGFSTDALFSVEILRMKPMEIMRKYIVFIGRERRERG